MSEQPRIKSVQPDMTIEHVTSLSQSDMNDLCDATDEAIKDGGGFGWVKLPSRDILERFWTGVLAMPTRDLFVARLDGVICGTAQLIQPARNDEARAHVVHLTTNFIVPWARGYRLAKMLLEEVEKSAQASGFSVINLDVRETQEAAIKLYESNGYQKFGTHPNYAKIDGKTIQGFYYSKEIA